MKTEDELHDAQIGISKLYHITRSKYYEKYLDGVNDTLNWVLGD